MWNKFERYVVPKDAVVDVIKGSNISKMDQDIMREKLQRQRENIVQEQVAAGRVFKGKSSFNSKPTVIHFKVGLPNIGNHVIKVRETASSIQISWNSELIFLSIIIVV